MVMSIAGRISLQWDACRYMRLQSSSDFDASPPLAFCIKPCLLQISPELHQPGKCRRAIEPRPHAARDWRLGLGPKACPDSFAVPSSSNTAAITLYVAEV